MHRGLILATILIGFSIPIQIELDICEKGTVMNFHNGETVCVGEAVEHSQIIDTESVMLTCERTNPKWTGIAELRPRGVIVCY